MNESHFSATYIEARRRFKAAATAVGANIDSYPIDFQDTKGLTIDVATVGLDGDPTVLISSGVHGVEGFFGSAIQHAFLIHLAGASIKSPVRFVLLHAVNPFGFSQLRRCNEDNVDLNRNFLPANADYTGVPEGYDDLNQLLNPASAPAAIDLFRLKAIWNVWHNGLEKLKLSVASGQYKYPKGLFFGGYGPSNSTQIIVKNCDSWIGSSKSVLHIDFHSGLGRFADYKLLVNEPEDKRDFSWYTSTFGNECVESLFASKTTAYKVSGGFGEWMQNHFKQRSYRFIGAEFGTYNVIRVLKALRAENQACHYGDQDNTEYQRIKAEILECFCPKNPRWRKSVITSGLEIVTRGIQALVNKQIEPDSTCY